MKTAIFDIETSDLAGVGAGIVFCACIRSSTTGQTRTFRLDEYHYDPDPNFGYFVRQEKDLLRDITEELAKYQLLVGHRVKKFDLPYLRTRAIVNQMSFPLNPFVYDTMDGVGRVHLATVLNALGKNSKALSMAIDLFGIPQEKTALYPLERWQIIWGNEAERADKMNGEVDHCQRDVRMTHQLYDVLLPLDFRANIKRWT